MLVRLAALLSLIFLSVANFASAQTLVDVGAMGSSQNLVPFLRLLTTDNANVRAELGRDAAGKPVYIELKSSRDGPSHRWGHEPVNGPRRNAAW
jgi:hypothetical protein